MEKESRHIVLIVVLFVFSFSNFSQSQEYKSQRIKQLIDADSLKQAEKELSIQTDYYTKLGQTDSLAQLIYFHGRIPQIQGKSNFIEIAENALSNFKRLNPDPSALHDAYFGIADLARSNELFQISFDYHEKGYEVAKNAKKNKLSMMSNRAYGMASTSYFMRDFEKVKKYGRESYKLNKKNPEASATSIYNACNILGIMMQNDNKLDSALYYYNQGVKALKSSNGNLKERLYYPAVLNANTAVVLMNQGKIYEALKLQELAKEGYKSVLDSLPNDPTINSIRYNYLATINDIGSSYVKLGQIERAEQLFEYNYLKAKEFYPENSIQQLVFTNQYAQGKWVSNDHETALKLIDESYERLKELGSNYAGYMTYGLGTKANILENMGKIPEAYKAFKQSDSLYNIVDSGSYSHDRLAKLREAALFYSRNNYKDEALAVADEITENTISRSSINILEQIKTNDFLAEINYNLGNNKEAIRWCTKTIELIDESSDSENSNVSIYNQLKLNALMYKAGATFKMVNEQDIEAMLGVFDDTKKIIEILNENSSRFTSSYDKSQFFYTTINALDFAISVSLRLYKLTEERQYLDYIIAMKEASLYNIIRSKIAVREDIKFKNIPEKIIEREIELKDSLNNLNLLDFDKEFQDNYVLLEEKWSGFIKTIKEKYPEYYNLKYKSINPSNDFASKNLPENTTVIRYMFIEDSLYAFVADKEERELIALNSNNLEEEVEFLSKPNLNEKRTLEVLYNLYKKLWYPLENKLKNEKIIIIPDEELFNLSFETLCEKLAPNYIELSKISLLKKHIIS
ncbi:MAG: hypothetical protein AAF688_05280, partial [Bacteroidota bacterium]